MQINLQRLNELLFALYDDVDQSQSFPEKRPLMAHYTSISTLERIMATDELWFSNPLFMSDLEELRVGLFEGIQRFTTNEAIKGACGTAQRHALLMHAFHHYSNLFSNEHALDVYVFCLSEHDKGNTDGLLSMWRGYGGNGNGAAIVFDAGQLGVVQGSPLVIGKVQYATPEQRIKQIDDRLAKFAAIFPKLELPDERLELAAWAIFLRIKMLALFTKHHGFLEEREWRVVYLKERDSSKKLEQMCHYALGNRGIEPKLKFEVKPHDGLTAPDLSLSKIVHKIILGPTVSSPLAKATVLRMLEKVGKKELQDRVLASTIPFRAVG